MSMAYPFTEQEAQDAYDEWGCNCGPAALAFALQVPLDEVRPLIPGFEQKRYTSPSMMKAALRTAGIGFESYEPTRDEMFYHDLRGNAPTLVRIQWTGPWTQPGANPKWAYRQTHWVTTYTSLGREFVFDVNGGVREMASWEAEIVPLLVEMYPRADGGWFPTHVWRLEPESSAYPRCRICGGDSVDHHGRNCDDCRANHDGRATR